MFTFNSSNYYEQSKRRDDIQRLHGEHLEYGSVNPKTLQFIDTITHNRELCKMGTLVGVVSSAVSIIFHFNPNVPLICTATSGVLWLSFAGWAKLLEYEAQDIILGIKQNYKYEGITTLQNFNKTYDANILTK